MNLRHLQWFIDEPLPDPEVTLYQISPYSREDAARIIRHLCALAKIDLGQMGEDPASAERIRQALGHVVNAACARQALLDLNKIDRDIGEPPWRDRLRDLRNDRRQFATAIGDKSARTAPQWALIDIRQASRAGRRWLHYLRDHPAVLRKTIERALEALILQRDVGRTDRLDRVLFVEDVSRAYELLTGEPLGRSVTSDTKSRPGGRPTGPGLRLVWICLKPLDPLITDDAVAWAIRRVQERASGLTP
jgi:hypothetical protein